MSKKNKQLVHLLTEAGEALQKDPIAIPWNTYPRPQMKRDSFICLNGEWEILIGGTDGPQPIRVPFCPESKLSGVGNTDFMNGVWYKRTVRLDPQEDRVLLHFGAVDYRSTVFVNGQAVGTHKGGYASFQFDITGFVHPGENEIAVFAAVIYMRVKRGNAVAVVHDNAFTVAAVIGRFGNNTVAHRKNRRTSGSSYISTAVCFDNT